MAASPRPFDRQLHRRRITRAANRFAAADFLKRRAAEDLVDRLEPISRRFPTVVDLGARTGSFVQALDRRDCATRVDRVIETDLSGQMLRRRPGLHVVADEERLPFAAACADLVVSSLALHWVNDLVGALVQIRQVLRPDGLFLGALLGGATLTELRQVCMDVDLELSDGAAPRVSPFVDAVDAGDLLRRAGFSMPVVDIDRVVARYDHPLRLMADLRSMGETSALFERSRVPLSRRALARLGAVYAERFADADGRIPATFEIITLTGWAPGPDQPQPLKPGTGRVRLAAALRMSSTRSD